jgi:hypothetical protein
LVRFHDVQAELQACGAQRLAHQIERRVALRRGHLLEANALPNVNPVVDVRPSAPFGIVDSEDRLDLLCSRQRRKKVLGGRLDRCRGHARRFNRKEAGNNARRRRDTHIRLIERRKLVGGEQSLDAEHGVVVRALTRDMRSGNEP